MHFTTLVVLFAGLAAAAPAPQNRSNQQNKQEAASSTITIRVPASTPAPPAVAARAPQGNPDASITITIQDPAATAPPTILATKPKPGKQVACADGRTNGPVVSHTVVQGDTLPKLADTFQSGICNIAGASKIENPDVLSIGQVLSIPSLLCERNVDDSSCLANTGGPNAGATCLENGPATIKIKAGDTFIGIAKEMGLTEKAVLDANKGVDRFNLQVGQTINLPVCNK